MFFKLAIHNVRRSLRDYAIYFLTLTFGVCLFYVFNSMDSQQAMTSLNSNQREIIHWLCIHFYFLYLGLFGCLLQPLLNETTQKRIGHLHAVRHG